MMRVTPEMKIKEVLDINEHMVDALTWISPALEGLRSPPLRRAMSERTSVAQVARIAGVSLNEALFVLNLTAGEEEKRLIRELELRPEDPDYRPANLSRPPELSGLRDDDQHVIFVDVIPRVWRKEDPRPAIMHGLTELRDYEDVLLVRHTFNALPLRQQFAKRGFASWAEERRLGEWYIYFYRPTASAGAAAPPPLATVSNRRAMAVGA